MRYVDPDGRENVYSYKLSDNKYCFSSDFSTLNGTVKSLYGLIPFVGGVICEGINNAFGFRTIDKNDGYSRLMSVASPILDTASNLNLVSDLVKITGTAAKITGDISKIAGIISYLSVAGDFCYNLSKVEEVSINSLIDSLLGSSLVSSSHENVAALYAYAVSRMTNLISEGCVKYTSDKIGSITGYSYTSVELIK